MADDAPQRRPDHRASTPLLIVGAPRSGTTLVQRAMLADARCCGGQESHFFASFGQSLRDFDRKRSLERPHGLACYWRREELLGGLREMWGSLVGRMLAASPDASLLVEKTPDHALWLDVIAEVLPAARVVHVVRDSRAVCASLLAAGREPWGRPWAPRSAASAARIWRAHVEAVGRCSLPLHRIRFEEIEVGSVGALRDLWRFAGLDADDAACGRFLEVARKGSAGFAGTGEITLCPPEPAGFHRVSDHLDGRARWRSELGWLDRRRIWRETREQMEQLGYREDGGWERP